MKTRFNTQHGLTNLDDIVKAIYANDDACLEFLRSALMRIRPSAEWLDDELGSGELPAGEWWVTDPVEGNINQIHGMNDWGVTATLVRDNQPVLTVVYLPLNNNTYSAVNGDGAYLDGVRLSTSVKTELNATLVGTGQAKPGEDLETYRRIGQSIAAMLGSALIVRVCVPATLQLIQIAAGRMDIFWQYSRLLAGALLVQEAGGIVTDIEGKPWSLSSKNFLASAPSVHAAAAKTLSNII